MLSRFGSGFWCVGCEAESKCNGKEEAREFEDLMICCGV